MALEKKFWEDYFEVYDSLNLLIPYIELLNSVLDSLQIKRGEQILDAGSGTGNLSLKIKELGGIVTSLDASIEATNRHREKDKEANIILADLTEKLPFEDKAFDKISCVNVLYAIDNPKRLALLKEFNRVLKGGGLLVLTNPTGNKPINIYLDHIKKDLKSNGFAKAFVKLLKYIPNTIKMIKYNKKIVGKLSNDFPKLEEQKKLLSGAGFVLLDSFSVYSGESVLVKVKKENSN